MSTDSELIGLIDRPDAAREALANVIEKGGHPVAVSDSVDALPRDVVLVVVHARALSLAAGVELAARWPVVMVTEGDESAADSAAMAEAAGAGVIDYLPEPLRQAPLLQQMIRRIARLSHCSAEQSLSRQRLEERNERLETHLELLRLDQQAGGHIQRRLLPLRPRSEGEVSCDYWLAPSLYLSGDFLDFKRFNDRYTLFYFADVSGHGVASAFVTVLLRYLFNRMRLAWDGQNPEALPANWLSQLNQELLDTGIGKHATLFMGVIDQQTRYLHYSMGAQLPMPLLVADGKAQPLAGEGMPVGLFPDLTFPQLGCELPASFQLWLCSDGVLECLPGDTLTERLADLTCRVANSGSVAAFIEGLSISGYLARESEWLADDDDTDQELPDDLTIMTLGGFVNDNA
ncbi:PP2C family protein-serine/threonine phosphatase [Halomonas halocynthiae]|uniref:PP2C family protein-serine/threonine phosphatase n=1 Tax=Halomonas halocynthiae TaxID=176290 RepID=UPI0003FC903F|nr:PP2C family protein-serine/threonine phosphatase [Halomonas halocynthiae]